MSTGGRHATLTETMAVLGIPTITKSHSWLLRNEMVRGGRNFLKVAGQEDCHF